MSATNLQNFSGDVQIRGTTFIKANTNTNNLAIGTDAGLTAQGSQTVAVGNQAGNTSQSMRAVAVGAYSGNSEQGQYAVAMGWTAGMTSQGIRAVAVGHAGGSSEQGAYAVAVGYAAGQTSQSTQAVAVGYKAGNSEQGAQTIAVGTSAGQTSQGTSAVAMGWLAGNSEQGGAATAVGYKAGRTSQGAQATALGYLAGTSEQGDHGVAVGSSAGQTSQGAQGVAVGYTAGSSEQGVQAVAMGYQAGQTSQGANAVAVGRQAGISEQGASAVAVGREAGKTSQGTNAVAVGYATGLTKQGTNGTAVGRGAGATSQGASAVAIGAYAGVTGQGANSIILNGTGVALNTTTASSFHVKPVRGGNMTASALSYTSGGEIVEQTNMHFDGSGNVGIGTNAPSRILHLFKNATGSHYQRIQNVENNDGCGIELMRGNTTTFGATAYSDWRINNNAHLDFGVKFTGTDKPSVLHLNTNGFVGIGTDAPTNVLTIRGVSGKAFAMSDLRSNAVVKVQADYDADDGLFIGLIDRHSTLDGNNPSPYLQSNWDGSASVRPLLINPLGGGVGIGTLDPVSSLHIATTGDFSISNTADKSGVNERIGRILFYNGTNLAGAAIESCVNVGGANNNADIRFMTSYDNNTKLAERMRIDRAGKVGFGTGSPAEKIDVGAGGNIRLTNPAYKGVRLSNAIYFHEGGNANELSAPLASIQAHDKYNNSGNYRAQLELRSQGGALVTLGQYSGVGIGTTNPGYGLDVRGTGQFTNSLNVSKDATRSSPGRFSVTSGDTGIRLHMGTGGNGSYASTGIVTGGNNSGGGTILFVFNKNQSGGTATSSQLWVLRKNYSGGWTQDGNTAYLIKALNGSGSGTTVSFRQNNNMLEYIYTSGGNGHFYALEFD